MADNAFKRQHLTAMPQLIRPRHCQQRLRIVCVARAADVVKFGFALHGCFARDKVYSPFVPRTERAMKNGPMADDFTYTTMNVGRKV